MAYEQTNKLINGLVSTFWAIKTEVIWLLKDKKGLRSEKMWSWDAELGRQKNQNKPLATRYTYSVEVQIVL